MNSHNICAVCDHTEFSHGYTKMNLCLDDCKCKKFKSRSVDELEDIIIQLDKKYDELKTYVGNNYYKYVEDKDNQPCPSCGGNNTTFNTSDLEDLRLAEYIICNDCYYGT